MKTNLKDCAIRLHPHDRTIRVDRGASLLQALYEHNIFLRTDCGGRGICGKCRVQILGNPEHYTQVNACSIIVDKDLTIEIPLESMLSPEVIEKAPVTLSKGFISMIQEGNKPEGVGIAIDLGTTTIAVYLVTMNKAKIQASLSLKNPQALYGDDVMSRVNSISIDSANLAYLQTLVVKTIELGIRTLLDPRSLSVAGLDSMVVVGNPTLIHLFLGVNPHSIGIAPYRPVFCESRVTPSGCLGFEYTQLSIHTLPLVSGFIGGDLLSAALASNIDQAPPGTLLIDIGTNGELLLKAASGLYATSCATGPAFEGATLSCGMQAVSGAINKVVIQIASKPPKVNVLSQKSVRCKIVPAGICGSGIISGIAQMVRTGIVKPPGNFSKNKVITNLKDDVPAGMRYLLFNQGKTDTKKEVYISQKDIRAIQLGKSALITGIKLLMRKAGIERLEKIILAGAFGSHLNPDDLITLGMIPDIDTDKVVTAGNLAGAGAVMALCDEQCRHKAERLAKIVKTIELADDPEFQGLFIKHMAFERIKASGQ